MIEILCQELGMVVHAYNPNTWETKAGGLRVEGQSGLYSKTVSTNKQKDAVEGPEMVCTKYCLGERNGDYRLVSV
jgi:hypothetical protein